MTADIVERVRRASRYRGIEVALVERLAAEELPKARNADDAVKRVKRRLHQAVGAFRQRDSAQPSWPADDPDALRAACLAAMRGHASTRERLPYLQGFHDGIWAITGPPQRILDLGCGLHPLALPWMEIADARYVAVDVDTAALRTARTFLEAVGQPHRVEAADLVEADVTEPADVAFLLKLVTTLDRQDPGAATRLLRRIDARYAVVSFAVRSLGGRGDARDSHYRERAARLIEACGRVSAVAEASVANELVFVLALDPVDG